MNTFQNGTGHESDVRRKYKIVLSLFSSSLGFCVPFAVLFCSLAIMKWCWSIFPSIVFFVIIIGLPVSFCDFHSVSAAAWIILLWNPSIHPSIYRWYAGKKRILMQCYTINKSSMAKQPVKHLFYSSSSPPLLVLPQVPWCHRSDSLIIHPLRRIFSLLYGF